MSNRDQQAARDAVRDVLAAETAGKLADQKRHRPDRDKRADVDHHAAATAAVNRIHTN